MLPLLATHLLKKARWSAPEPLALPAAGLPGSRGGNCLAMSALHFFATSTDIAEARSGAHALAVVPPGSTTDDRTRRLVVIDAGMTELIRPALYGAEHAVVALTSLGRAPRPDAVARPTRVDGPICESTDMLGEHLLPPLRRGDLVAIADTGAYAASMRSAYNGRPRPAEVFVEADGSLTLARRRATLGSLG